MKCSNCKREISSNSRFCTYCGTPVSQSLDQDSEKNSMSESAKSKNHKKVLILILFLVIALLFTAVLYFFKPVSSSYQQLIDSGEKYLYELNYVKAEEYFQEARKLDPKNPQPYEKLYEVYLESENEENLKTIQTEARENLSDDDFKQFTDITDKIGDEYNESHPEYDVIADLGRLDIPPIDVGNSGWIIEKDGKFGLINSEGKTVFETEGGSFLDSMTSDNLDYACIYRQSYGSESVSNLPEKLEQPSIACGAYGEAVEPGVYAVNENNELVFITADGESEAKIDYNPNNYSLIVPKNPKFSASDQGKEVSKSLKDKEFYIYNPAEKKTFGPFEPDDIPAFSKKEMNSRDFNLNHSFTIPSQIILGPYSVHEDDEYILYTADGKKSVSGFDKTEIISNHAIAGFRKNILYVYDADLNEIYRGKFEGGAKTIDGITPVKINGAWKLVHFEKEKKESDMELEKKEEHNMDSENNEDKKEPVTPIYGFDFSSIAGSYTSASGAGAWAFEMNINSDGTFTAVYHDADLSPVPTMTYCEFSGRLTEGPEQQGLPTLIVSDTVLTNPAGTSKLEENGMTTEYISNDNLGMGDGTVMTLYSSGFPTSSLPQTAQMDLQYRVGFGADVLDRPILTTDRSAFIQD